MSMTYYEMRQAIERAGDRHPGLEVVVVETCPGGPFKIDYAGPTIYLNGNVRPDFAGAALMSAIEQLDERQGTSDAPARVNAAFQLAT